MQRALDRRRFLAAAGAVSAAAAPARAAAASRRIVLGVMGMQRGLDLARGFVEQPDVELKYVCDVDQRRLEAAQKGLAQRGVACQAVGDFRRILDDRDVDALVCAAPNHWHAPATIMACNAGKHVYVEKPCCHNPQEGEWMIQAARRNGRAVQMGAQRRSGPKTQEAMQRLAAGEIGRVYKAQCWYFSQRGSIGVGSPADPPAELDYDLWQGPAPRAAYMNNRIPYNWHWFWQWGNGELGNNGVHTLDLGRWGLQVEFPVRVTSSGGRYGFQDDQQTPDTHTVCLEFADRKAIVWTGHSCNGWGDGFVTFYGDHGAMTLDDQRGGFTLYDRQGKQVLQESGPRGDKEHLANFLQAIREDRPLALTAEIAEGHRSTLLCHLGNIAHRTGRTLQCDPTDGHILHDPEAMQLWSRTYEPGWEPQV